MKYFKILIKMLKEYNVLGLKEYNFETSGINRLLQL